MPKKIFFTNFPKFKLSKFSSNAHIDLWVLGNSAYFVKSTSPRAFSIFI